MTFRVAHLSDLHFGRSEQATVEALADDVRAVRPDLVAVSGDLTQRARRAEFEAASSFLAALQVPVVAVPGNHDVPLWNLARRLASPLGRFDRFIGARFPATFEAPGIRVLGIDTAHGHTWKSGRFAHRHAAALEAWRHAGTPLRVLVGHHPLLPDPQGSDHGLRGSHRARGLLTPASVDVILAGHLHIGGHHLRAAARDIAGVLCIQAGTATSTRLRGEANSYNVLEWRDPWLTIEVRRGQGAPGTAVARPLSTPEGRSPVGFATAGRAAYERVAGGWRGPVPQPGGHGAQRGVEKAGAVGKDAP